MGIRIAALPPNRKKSRTAELGQKDVNIGNGLNSLSPQPTTTLPDRGFHDVEGSSPGSSSTQQSPPPLLGDNHPVASHGNGSETSKHRLRFAPRLTTPVISVFSKSPRVSGALSVFCRRWMWKMKEFEWLKPTLTFLFGVTTPFGMGIGMAVWSRRANDDPGEEGTSISVQLSAFWCRLNLIPCPMFPFFSPISFHTVAIFRSSLLTCVKKIGTTN